MTTVYIPTVGKVDLYSSIIPGGNFSWAEATKSGSRLPPDGEIAQNIIDLARNLQVAREQIKRPFHIISWYRPPHINKAVGGAIRSQHLYGKAVDLWVEGFTGLQLSRELHWWNGGMGCYSDRPKTLHLDTGSKRQWGI